MKCNFIWTVKTIFLLMGLLMYSVVPSNAASELQHYSFKFDLTEDKQHAVIIDYWYGNSASDSWIFSPKWLVEEGKTLTTEGITGSMPTTGTLYVKWRNTDTGQVYEDTVDLRHRLPKNVEDDTIYLMIREAQLYVYLISSKRRPPYMPMNGPQAYRSQIVTTIYPDQIKP